MTRCVLKALFVGVFLTSACVPEFTSDDELIRTFGRHRNEAAELVEMIQTDLCPFVRPKGINACGLEQSHLREYTSRLEQLGAFGIQRGSDFVTISMSHTSQGDKGLLYSPLRDLPSTPSLDVKPGSESVAYRHLDGPWYLYIDIID